VKISWKRFRAKVYIVGICLFIVGCTLALSISSTILLILVINVSIDQNKREENQILEYKLNSGGRIIQYHQLLKFYIIHKIFIYFSFMGIGDWAQSPISQLIFLIIFLLYNLIFLKKK